MDYADYQVHDFLTDPDFVRWAKSPTPQEDVVWQAFLREHPHQQATIQQAKAVLQSLRFEEEAVPETMVLAEWDRFKETHAIQPEEAGRVIPLRTYRSVWWAAAMVVGLLIGLFWWTRQPVPDIIYRTRFGQLRTINLPDGSTLTLNANSEARLPGNWSDRPTREVSLRGEGFFQVVKRTGQSQQRFVVHTGELDVEVLGTSFNVHSRRQQADVLLQTGSVRLRLTKADTARSVLMRPGDGVRYRQPTGQLERRVVRADQMSAWTMGVLVLDRMTLRDLGQVIEDTYGRRVVIRSPALARRVLSGSVLTSNERALLEGISVTLNVPVRIEQNTIVFGN